jgi:hypothetical protein
LVHFSGIGIMYQEKSGIPAVDIDVECISWFTWNWNKYDYSAKTTDVTAYVGTINVNANVNCYKCVNIILVENQPNQNLEAEKYFILQSVLKKIKGIQKRIKNG